MCARAAPTGNLVSLCDTVQLMAQNLRGEVSLDFAGTKLCLSDSRFIQVIAKSLSISCKEVSDPSGSFFFNYRNRDDFFQTPGLHLDLLSLHIGSCPQELAAIRDALTPPLACAAAKIGDIEALEALKEMVNRPVIASLNISVSEKKGKVSESRASFSSLWPLM